MSTTAARAELSYMNFGTTSYHRSAYNRDRQERSRLQKKRARQLEVRKHIIQLVFAVLFIFVMLFFVNHIVSKASTGDDMIYFKYYTTIEVQAHETLSGIAEKYADDIHYDSLSDYMDEVIFINHLEDGDQIKAGTYLTIPYYSTEFK